MTWQVALSILAGLIFVAVIAYNAWVLRKNTPKPPLRASKKNEPELSGGKSSTFENKGTGASIDTSDFVDMEFDSSLSAAAEQGLGASKHNEWKLDERLDAIVTMALPQASTPERILAHAPDTSKRVGTKPQILEALNVHTDVWEYPQPGQQYIQVRLGVQMLNRHGAITDLEYSEFANSAQLFGDQLDVLVDIPDMRDVVQTAREIDAVSSQYDVQLKLHIVPETATWTAGFVEEQAADVGFVKTNLAGSMRLLSAGEPVETVLRLEFDSAAAVAAESEEDTEVAVDEVQLCLDVPCVRQELQPYEALSQAATILAQRLQGKVTDTQGASLDEEQVKAIGKQLRERYRELATAGLTAGSPLCMRMYAN